jgi:hypothetical protein
VSPDLDVAVVRSAPLIECFESTDPVPVKMKSPRHWHSVIVAKAKDQPAKSDNFKFKFADDDEGHATGKDNSSVAKIKERFGCDWYCELSPIENHRSGSRPPRAQAHVQARKVAASHAVGQLEDSTAKVSRLYRHLEDFDAPLIDD